MKFKYLQFMILGASLLFVGPVLSHEGSHTDLEKTKSSALPGDSIYNATSKWTDQNGKSVRLSELRGKPAVAVMAYTSCEHACPLLTEDMKKIESKLSAKSADGARWVFFSLDSERDTSAALLAYAKKRKLNLHHWTLFHGDPKAVRELAAMLGVQYKKDAQGDFDHSNLISLINSDGTVIYQQVGLNQDPKEFISRFNAL
jgi:protein SCO1/2